MEGGRAIRSLQPEEKEFPSRFISSGIEPGSSEARRCPQPGETLLWAGSQTESFCFGAGGEAGREVSCWVSALSGTLSAGFKTQGYPFTLGASSLEVGNYLSPHHTGYTVLSVRAKASSYLHEHGPFYLLWALASPRALVCSPAVPLPTPATGSFHLKTHPHPSEYSPLPGFSHPPPHLVHTPDLTASDPHGKSQAHLCSASLRQWWDPASSSQIPSLVDVSY